ncbi:MAG TPA: sulfatase, partial [Thermoanaerobaculia bacterium]|nr:sulfatase [Thermoanaerobaculia bacterium]
SGRPAIVRDHTVSTPYRWEPLAIDLAGLAGETVALALELEAETEGVLGFWGAPALRSRRAAEPGRPRGVILVQMDTLRRDHLDAYGHRRPTAPHLARLAAEGVLFRNTFAQAPWTKVSTPSILTSLYPSTHGVRGFNDRLPAGATTVAEAFRDAGYATLSLSSVIFTGQYTNLHQGFEELHEAGSLANRGGPLSAKTAREQVDRLLDWIERRDGSPFFAFLHVFDPHFPYEPYQPYDTLWVSPERRAEHVRQRDQASQRITDEFMRVRQLPSRDEVAASGFDPEAYVTVETDWYDASIRAMDVEIGRLVERLRAAGLGEQVLLVLTSDHGTEFYEHGGMWHGHSLYGELTDVPLIAHWPGRVAAGRAIEEVVQTIDVMPTLLELAGLPRPEAVQGQSLAPFLDPAARPAPDGAWAGWRRRPAFAERFPYAPDLPPPRDRTSYALIDGEWKLIEHRTPGAPPYELFDWRRDPLNRSDLAARHPEVVARLGKTLAAWRRHVEAARLPADSQSATSLSPEELERLRSLGYIR